jgi:hypothetical protein
MEIDAVRTSATKSPKSPLGTHAAWLQSASFLEIRAFFLEDLLI